GVGFAAVSESQVEDGPPLDLDGPVPFGRRREREGGGEGGGHQPGVAAEFVLNGFGHAGCAGPTVPAVTLRLPLPREGEPPGEPGSQRETGSAGASPSLL